MKLNWKNILGHVVDNLILVTMVVLALSAFFACTPRTVIVEQPVQHMGPTPIPTPTPFRPDPNWVDTDVGRIYWFEMKNGDRCYVLREREAHDDAWTDADGFGIGVGMACVGNDSEILRLLEEILTRTSP